VVGSLTFFLQRSGKFQRRERKVTTGRRRRPQGGDVVGCGLTLTVKVRDLVVE